MVKGGLDLDGLLAFWNSLTNEERQELVKNLNEFNALRGSLKNRGLIECDEPVTYIKIVKSTPEVKRLLAVLKKTGAQGIKIIDNKGKIAS